MKELEEMLKKIVASVGKEAIYGGGAVFILGFFIHMFIFANHYPTYSGLNLFINDGKWHAIEGRWFSAVVEKCTSFVTIPTFIGLLSLFFWAVSYALLIRLFDIKSHLMVFLAAGVFISYPSIAGYYTFLYTAHCFALGCMLSICGVCLLLKNSLKTSIGGCICFIFALATYQNTISIAMVIAFMMVAFSIIDGEEILVIMKRILRYSLVIVISFLVYYVSFKAYLLFSNTDSYRDFSISFETILKGIIKCYGGAYWFWIWGTVFSLKSGRIIVLLLSTVLIIEVIIIFYNRNRSWSNAFFRCIMLLGLIVLLPIVANFVFLVSPDEARTYRQFISYLIIFLAPFIILERYQSDITSFWKKKGIKEIIFEFVILIYSAVTILFFDITDNVAYMNMHLQYEKEYSLAVRIVDRIENTDGYESGMPVMIILRKDYGHLYGGKLESQLDKYIPGMEQQGWGIMSNPIGIKNFIEEFIQTDINIVNVETDMEKLSHLEKWPSKDCTQIMDGVLYIYIS